MSVPAGESSAKVDSSSDAAVQPSGSTKELLLGKVSPDRHSVSSQRIWLLTAAVGLMLWSALASLPTSRSSSGGSNVAVQAALLCAVLAMFGLRSVPLRWIVRGLALVSGVLLARFGELGPLDGLQGSWHALLWLVAVAGCLVLAPSSRTIPGVDSGTVLRADQLPGQVPGHDSSSALGTPATSGRVRSANAVPVALMAAAAALVVASALLLGPRVSDVFPVGPSAGELINQGDNRTDNALVARDSLDMTTRPRLTEQIVMSVRSPITAFWRAETFDQWDGSTWTRTAPRSGRLIEDGKVVASPEDVAAKQGQPTLQQFRLEVGFATALPSAASAVRVETADEIAQHADGTLWSPGAPLGRGATYSVTSRQIATDPKALRATPSAAEAAAAGDRTAAAVIAQFARPPTTTARVRELAAQVTASSRSDFARVKALEGWMDANTSYSLDAPLAPKGSDVVDHFLFVSQEGWCEQIASSLVVLARASGVPARLATGFAPGEWDATTGRFVVRERDAHAWAEVWFASTGWVAFDPTAAVPLAGSQEATPGADARDWREVLGALLLAFAAVVLAAGPVWRWVRRQSGRVRRTSLQRKLVRTRWDVAAEARLERIGDAAGRPRGPGETLTFYAGALAGVLEDNRVEQVGVILDRTRYQQPSPSAAPAGEVDTDSQRDSAFIDEVFAAH
ncbi:MAG: transglutaminase domain-containing protein [Actinomycetes bacterium]